MQESYHGFFNVIVVELVQKQVKKCQKGKDATVCFLSFFSYFRGKLGISAMNTAPLVAWNTRNFEPEYIWSNGKRPQTQKENLEMVDRSWKKKLLKIYRNW